MLCRSGVSTTTSVITNLTKSIRVTFCNTTFSNNRTSATNCYLCGCSLSIEYHSSWPRSQVIHIILTSELHSFNELAHICELYIYIFFWHINGKRLFTVDFQSSKPWDEEALFTIELPGYDNSVAKWSMLRIFLII